MASDAATIELAESFSAGFSWRRAGNGLMQCRSHALIVDDAVWLIDPIDGDELDGMIADHASSVAGVIVLLDRHLRDSVAVAERHGARLVVPPGQWRSGHAAPDGSEQLAADVDGCPFSFHPVITRDGAWLEWALWHEAARVLVVPEAVGTADYYRSRAKETLAVHPILRVVSPPRRLTRLEVEPELLLVGHGDSLAGEDVAVSIELAVSEARRELPFFALSAVRHSVRWMRAAIGVGRASC